MKSTCLSDINRGCGATILVWDRLVDRREQRSRVHAQVMKAAFKGLPPRSPWRTLARDAEISEGSFARDETDGITRDTCQM